MLLNLVKIASQIFDLPQEWFLRNEYDRASNPQLQKLVRDMKGEYGIYCPLLFPDGVLEGGVTKETLRHLFLSIPLARVSVSAPRNLPILT